MNAALTRMLLRKPAPSIVPYLIEAIDRMDPTRSHESKPSVRMRNRATHRRLLIACWSSVLGLAALAALAVQFH